MSNWVSLSEQINIHLHEKICFLKDSNELGNLVRPFSVGLCPTVIFLRYLKEDIQIFDPSRSTFTQEISIWPVIGVQDSLPCDCAGVNVQECKLSETFDNNDNRGNNSKINIDTKE